MTSMSSPPPSPLFSRSHSSSSNTAHMSLGVANIANLFVKMRQQRSKTKTHLIVSSSGDAPQTHSSLQHVNADSAEHAKGDNKISVPLVEDRTFVCIGGVDAVKLLRAVRGLLYQEASEVGLNVLVDEQWTCTISGPRRRSDGPSYRVHIHYTANGTRLDKPDLQRPVALGNARGVPGLMTIVSRLD